MEIVMTKKIEPAMITEHPVHGEHSKNRLLTKLARFRGASVLCGGVVEGFTTEEIDQMIEALCK